MNNQPSGLIIGILFAIVIGFGTYWFGGKAGFARGYDAAEVDIQRAQEIAAEQAVASTIGAANPFKVENPLAGVETDPFGKVQNILNPFE